MIGLFRCVPATLAALGTLAQHRALAAYRAVPELRPTVPAEGPLVSVIVPARNEAANLRTLLPGLRALVYEPRELIVVDDDSTDETAALAAAGGARVVRTSGSPPDGWTGKTWACRLGAEGARGEWLLFADADTDHEPESLSAALAAAQAERLDALSVLPDQVCVGFWERLLLPFAYAGYFSGVDPGRVNRSPADALLNGQYVLVRRDAYRSIGGHAAVAGSLVEDVALGAALVGAGFRVGLYRAGGLVRVRMYRSREAVFAGFAKNAFGFTRLQPARGLRVAGATALAATAAGSLAVSVPVSLAGQESRRDGEARLLLAPLVLGIAALALGMSAHARWCRAFGVPRRYGLLQPLAGAAFLGIALRSGLASLGGPAIGWKGRRYRP